jgi:hypothetical protein
MELVHWMLQKDPEDRPKTGGVVARQLASILHRELDTRVTAVMHVHEPSGTRNVAFLIPGKQAIGTSNECLIQTASDGSNRVQATLSWGGIGTEAVLHPVAPFEGLRVDGQLLEQPVRLPAGTRIEAGRLRMHIEYPPKR